jgi:L-threonylcarbamoyladenylate synthase
MPDDPVEYAARIYATLREADAAGVHAILVEAPPPDDERWTAVLDRLKRAGGHT